jgi:hypothetical protein
VRSTIAHAQQIAYRARRFIDSPVGFTEEVRRLAKALTGLNLSLYE